LIAVYIHNDIAQLKTKLLAGKIDHYVVHLRIEGLKMRIFKYRAFHQWAKSEGLSDSALKDAINEIKQGLFDANLGGGLYKKRIARKGRGKSGGYRTIIAFKKNNRSIFMYGYAKNERDNISDKEELIYKKLAGYYLEITESKLNLLIKNGELFEVT